MTTDDPDPSADTVRVFVRDCAVPLYVGIYDHEKPQPQPVVIHVEARARLTHSYDDMQASCVEQVIDYEGIYDYVTTVLPGLGHIPLLESVAESIIRFCFRDPRVEEVRVKLEKPEAFKGRATAGIDMRRKRNRT